MPRVRLLRRPRAAPLLLALMTLVPCDSAGWGPGGAAAASGPPTAGKPAAREDRLIVKLKAQAVRLAELPEQELPRGVPGFEAWRRRHGIQEGHRLIRGHGVAIGDRPLFSAVGLDRIYVVRLPVAGPAEVAKAVAALSSETWVEYAEPVYRYEPLSTVPDDPLYPQQWNHENTGQTGGIPDADMDSTLAWDVSTGSSSAVIAVLDTGIDTDHPDLVGGILPGFDLTGSAGGIEDAFGHGTQVAGSAAARGNNSLGVAGMCWGCSILPIKILGDSGFATIEEIADGVRIAADSGADAINMSFGSVGWSQAFRDAVDYAVGMGALPVGGSGNSGTYSFFSPAAFPQVVSVVGSTDQDLRVGDFGDHAEVAAPLDFLTTSEGGGYESFWGTSAAAPLVAGLAGLLRSAEPTLHVQEVRQLIRLGAEDQVADPAEDTPGWDPYMGFGRVNAGRSMALIEGPWLALDRAHTLCDGEIWVDLKDTGAAGGVMVSLSGDLSGDAETVLVTPVTPFGYHRGGLPLSWAGPDGPAVPGDGRLHVVHGERIHAAVGGLAATARAECVKNVCLESIPALPGSGDCDADGVADPGEVWVLDASFGNYQTELMPTAVAVLGALSGSVEVLEPSQALGDMPPAEVLSPESFRFRVLPGSPFSEALDMEFSLTGSGWQSSAAGCAAAGHAQGFTVTANRDGAGPDSWTAEPPAGLDVSVAGCPAALDLSWDAVAGATGYNIYRSESSCSEALGLSAAYGTSSVPGFTDGQAWQPSDSFYAVEAVEAGTGCVSLRSCLPGACLCDRPADPTHLRLSLSGEGTLLVWDDPGIAGLTWNIYRETGPDPAGWSLPAHEGIVDADPATPGIQFHEAGGGAAGSISFYLVSAIDSCGESLLR